MTAPAPAAPAAEAPRSRLRLADQGREAIAVLREHPWRSLGSTVAVVLGIGAAVATLSLAETARHQVGAEFDALRATQVNVVPSDGAHRGPAVFPADVPERLDQLAGVAAAGVVHPVAPEVPVTVNPIVDATGGNATTADVLALGPGALEAAEPDISGTAWSSWHERDGVRVALLGATLAEALGIERVDPGQVVRVDGIPFALAGIVHGAAREPALLRAVLVPAAAAARTWPGQASEAPHVLVRVEPGAAAVVARQAALALRPDAPELLSAVAPPDPATLRRRVEAEVEGLLLVVGSVSLAVGTVGIGTSTMVSVLERRPELALRRALGARPAHLVRHVLTDTALLGLASAVVGTVAAVGVTLGVAAARGWSPVIDPRVLIAGPLVGSVVGAVAGVPAARRASRAEPAEAIRA